MKVLMITHGFPPECSGGTESYVLALSREFIEAGHKVEILTGSHEGAGPDVWEPRLEHSEHAGIRVHRLHRTGLFVDNWEKSLAPEVEPLLEYVLKDFAPDIVHVHHWIRLSRNLVEVCHDAGVPTVCTLHDLWTCCPKAFRIRENTHCELDCGPTNCHGCALPGENMSVEEELRELALFRDDFRNELDLARRLIVPSSAHRDVLLRQMPQLRGKFRVVQHGNISKLTRRRPTPSPFPDQPLRVGHWGHLSGFKGIDVLLEAVQGSANKNRIQLHLFGEVVYPQERKRVTELAEDLDVTWHGKYVPTDLAQVPMDVAVIPSRCSESWSFVLDEAFLLGLPVICSARGALGERVLDAGTTFDPDDSSDLTRVLDALFEAPESLHRWADNIPDLPLMRRHTQDVERVYHEVRSSNAPLPTTPRALRTRRLHVRSYQLELRNREMETAAGALRNLESDQERASASLQAMDASHREKDKEIERLNLELEALRAGPPDSLRSEHDAAQRRIKELEKKDRKKQRRVERLRTELEDRDSGPLSEEIESLVHRMQAIEATNAKLTLRERELDSQIEARLAEIGDLETLITQATSDRYEMARVDEKRSRSIEVERAAIKQLTLSLKSQQDRLMVLSSHSRLLGGEMEDLSAEAASLLDETCGTPDRDNPTPTAEDMPTEPGTPEPSFPISEADEALLSGITDAEAQVLTVLDHAITRQAMLQALLSRREVTVNEMAHTIDGLLDMIEGQERKRARVDVQRTAKKNGDRLKILMVVHQYLPRHVAGTEVYTHNLAKALSRRHDLLVLSAESDYDQERFAENRTSVDGVALHQVIHNYEWTNFRDTYDCPQADAVFRRLLREEQPDIVHIQHLHYFSLNFVTIARSLGIPVVYTLHDYVLMCARDGTLRREDGELCRGPDPSKCRDCIAHHKLDDSGPPVLPRGLKPGIDAMVPDAIARVVRGARDDANANHDDPYVEAAAERLDYVKRVLADVDLFVSPSGFLRDRFVESGLIDADRVIVSDNGYDLDRLPDICAPHHASSEELRVGYVGTIAEHKGIHTLVEAMNGITDDRISCHIWGDPTAFWHYTEQVRGTITNPRTFLMGPFANDRIADILGRLDLLVVPSLWFENSPLTLHEAAACGVPVLASDDGGLSEFVTPEVTGRLFKLGSVDDLRAGIISFLERPLQEFAPESLEIKSIEQDAQDTESRYYKLLARSEALIG